MPIVFASLMCKTLCLRACVTHTVCSSDISSLVHSKPTLCLIFRLSPLKNHSKDLFTWGSYCPSLNPCLYTWSLWSWFISDQNSCSICSLQYWGSEQYDYWGLLHVNGPLQGLVFNCCINIFICILRVRWLTMVYAYMCLSSCANTISI